MRDDLLKKAGYTVIRFKNDEANALIKNEKLLHERLIKITGETAATPLANDVAETTNTTVKQEIKSADTAQSQEFFKPKATSNKKQSIQDGWRVVPHKH